MLIGFLTVLAALPAASAAPQTCVDLPSLVEKVMPGVVNVSSTTVIDYNVYGWQEFMQFWGMPAERKQTSLGSGFIIDKTEGYILTNNHVVERASEVMVTLMDKHSYHARIVGKDDKMDVALLQIRDKNRKVPADLVAVPLGNSDGVRIGESVFAVGNPFGLQHTVTTGIISAKNRTIGAGPFDNFLQTDASINPGNSGGPLFDMKGEVIGINTMIFSRTGQSGGLGFAIPVNEARKNVADLIRYGRVPRPWLGILGEHITPPLEAYYRLPASQGILIINLVQDGPADMAGLRLGDIVVSANGAAIDELVDLEKIVLALKPKDRLALKIKRTTRTLEINIQLQELPPVANLPKGII